MSTPSIYTDGTISVTNGSVNFTGTGTAWSTQLKRGTLIVIGDVPAVVDAISADGAGTFASAWPGTTQAGAAYVAVTWNSGAEIAEGLRDLLTQLIGKGLFKVVSGVPVAANHREGEFVLNRDSLILYAKDQGLMVPLTAPFADPIGPWEGVPRSGRQTLSIVTGDVAINFANGANALLVVNAAAEIQLPTNVAVNDVIGLLFEIDGGPHALTWATGFTEASGFLFTQIRGGDGARSRVTITITAQTGGTATAATVGPVTFDKFDLVTDRGNNGYVSAIDGNFAEPPVDGIGDPISDGNWLYLNLPKGEPGSALVTGTSTSSVAIGAGNKSFTFAETEERGLALGAIVTVADAANPATNYMRGPITSFAYPNFTIAVPSNGFGGAGTIGNWVITLAGGPGADGTDPGYLLNFETATVAPPSAGAIRFNNANLSLATAAYVSVTNRAGSNIKERLLELYNAAHTVKDSFALVNPADDKQASFVVTNAADNTTYVTLSVGTHAGETAFAAGAISLQPDRAGGDGPTAVAGSPVTGNLAAFAGATSIADAGVSAATIRAAVHALHGGL